MLLDESLAMIKAYQKVLYEQSINMRIAQAVKVCVFVLTPYVRDLTLHSVYNCLAFHLWDIINLVRVELLVLNDLYSRDNYIEWKEIKTSNMSKCMNIASTLKKKKKFGVWKTCINWLKYLTRTVPQILSVISNS